MQGPEVATAAEASLAVEAVAAHFVAVAEVDSVAA